MAPPFRLVLVLAVGVGSSASPRERELVVFVHGWKAGGQTVKRLLNETVGARHIVTAFADDAHLLWPPGSSLTDALERPALTRAVVGGYANGVCDALATRPCATFTRCASRARARPPTSIVATRGPTTRCATTTTTTTNTTTNTTINVNTNNAINSNTNNTKLILTLRTRTVAARGPTTSCAAPRRRRASSASARLGGVGRRASARSSLGASRRAPRAAPARSVDDAEARARRPVLPRGTARRGPAERQTCARGPRRRSRARPAPPPPRPRPPRRAARCSRAARAAPAGARAPRPPRSRLRRAPPRSARSPRLRDSLALLDARSPRSRARGRVRPGRQRERRAAVARARRRRARRASTTSPSSARPSPSMSACTRARSAPEARYAALVAAGGAARADLELDREGRGFARARGRAGLVPLRSTARVERADALGISDGALKVRSELLEGAAIAGSSATSATSCSGLPCVSASHPPRHSPRSPAVMTHPVRMGYYTTPTRHSAS